MQDEDLYGFVGSDLFHGILHLCYYRWINGIQDLRPVKSNYGNILLNFKDNSFITHG